MIRVFIQDDLIRYLYGETNKQESQEIEALLLTDTSFQEEYRALKNIIKALDKVKAKPSQRTVEKIIAFAAQPEEQDILS